MTRELYQAQDRRDLLASALKAAELNYNSEFDLVNGAIRKVGFFAENIVRVVDGENTLVSTSELVDLQISKSGDKMVLKDEKKSKVERIAPPVVEIRPRRNNGGGNNNGKGNNNNNG